MESDMSTEEKPTKPATTSETKPVPKPPPPPVNDTITAGDDVFSPNTVKMIGPPMPIQFVGEKNKNT